MPIFKTTYNILKKYDEDELFDENWMDSDKLILPENKKWDYSRELKIEDVQTWEVIYESTNGIGVYASWEPYAEFYMITSGLNLNNPIRYFGQIPYYDRIVETYYGINASKDIYKRIRELDLPINEKLIWIDDDNYLKMKNAESKKTFFIT